MATLCPQVVSNYGEWAAKAVGISLMGPLLDYQLKTRLQMTSAAGVGIAGNETIATW